MFIAFEYFNFNWYRTLTYVKRFWILFIVLALYKFLIIIIIVFSATKWAYTDFQRLITVKPTRRGERW